MRISPPHPTGPIASWPLGLSHSVTVRPIRPEDIDLETEFAHKLSTETRYNRFLGAGVKLTPNLLEKFTRIDFSRDMALIAAREDNAVSVLSIAEGRVAFERTLTAL